MCVVARMNLKKIRAYVRTTKAVLNSCNIYKKFKTLYYSVNFTSLSQKKFLVIHTRFVLFQDPKINHKICPLSYTLEDNSNVLVYLTNILNFHVDYLLVHSVLYKNQFF